MKGNVLSRRYAGALIEIGLKEEQLERFGKELNAAVEMLASKEVWTSFSSPLLPSEAKVYVVDELAKRSGWSKTVSNFLKLLVEKKRITILPAVAESYAGLADKASGRVHATVDSAIDLDGGIKSRLVQKLVAMSNGQVVLDAHTDPSLIGGVKVQVESTVIDGTIRGQLARLKDLLK